MSFAIKKICKQHFLVEKVGCKWQMFLLMKLLKLRYLRAYLGAI
jgi:hypothetical protein